MTPREVRMRAIEAVAGMGIREPARLVKDAKEIAEWVLAAEGETTALRTRKAEDKAA